MELAKDSFAVKASRAFSRAKRRYSLDPEVREVFLQKERERWNRYYNRQKEAKSEAYQTIVAKSTARCIKKRAEQDPAAREAFLRKERERWNNYYNRHKEANSEIYQTILQKQAVYRAKRKAEKEAKTS